MPLTIGDTAPDFEAETSEGPIRFYDWLGNSWGVLFYARNRRSVTYALNTPWLNGRRSVRVSWAHMQSVSDQPCSAGPAASAARRLATAYGERPNQDALALGLGAGLSDPSISVWLYACRAWMSTLVDQIGERNRVSRGPEDTDFVHR